MSAVSVSAVYGDMGWKLVEVKLSGSSVFMHILFCV